MTIIQIVPAQVKTAAQVLSDAFTEDPLMLWMFNGKKNYSQQAKLMFELWLNWAVHYGLAIATSHFEAVAVRKKPGHHHFSFFTLLRSGLWKSFLIMGKENFARLMILGDAMEKEQRINMNNDLFWHCWILGTEPKFRGKGFANQLINYTNQLAHDTKFPCYLETFNQKNVPFFESKGFKLLSTVNLEHSKLTMYSMKKNC